MILKSQQNRIELVTRPEDDHPHVGASFDVDPHAVEHADGSDDEEKADETDRVAVELETHRLRVQYRPFEVKVWSLTCDSFLIYLFKSCRIIGIPHQEHGYIVPSAI